MIDCPDCDRPLHGKATCPCGWYDKSSPEPEQREPVKWAPPAQKVMEALKRAAKPKTAFPYWRPEIVTTQAQVNHIVRQAQCFGALSPAGRFLTECQDRGVITSDYRLGDGRKQEAA